MKYHELSITSNKNTTRVGRGIAAGKGKTAGRGTKGQSSRKSGNVRVGFEGGQNALYLRLPKLPGFKSIRPKVHNVYTGQLDALAPAADNFTLYNAGLLPSPHVKAKLVVKGEVTKKITVSLQGASKSAVTAIQKAGGTFQKVSQIKREITKTTKA